MADFELELDGIERLQSQIQELENSFADDAEAIVFSKAEYSEPLEFGRGPITSNGDDPLRFKIDGEWVSTHRVSGHPPYPFMRPAIREFEANPETFITEHTTKAIDEIDSTEELVRTVASALETAMKENVTAQSASGRSPGTHPEHPKVQTGELRRGIGFVMIT